MDWAPSPFINAATTSSGWGLRTLQTRPASAAVSSSGPPAAITAPSCMRLTRWQRSASSMYAVVISTVTPRLATSVWMIDQKSRREMGSTPVVGSSSRSTSGRWISVQMRASFWRIPPESWPAGRSRNRSSRVIRSSRSRLSPYCARGTRRRSRKNSMFSCTVSES
jgi:hypothetical protein